MVDYHIHTDRCGHAKGSLEEYYREAQRKGLEEIGFADHFPLDLLGFTPPIKVTMEGEELSQYVIDIDKLRQEKNNPSVKLGIEVDYLPGREEAIKKEINPYPFDYIMGSVHFLGNWDFTNPQVAYEYENLKDHEIFKIHEEYFQLIEEVVQSGIFDIIGHIDVIKKFGYLPRKGTRYLMERVSDLLKDADICIEVNTAGFYAPIKEFYPGLELLKLCYHKRIPITLGSDAHRPADVGRDIKKALAVVKEVGYREIALFRRRERNCRKI